MQGRNDVRGPGFFTVNFSIVKDTPISALGEAGKIQFRVETFNLLNRANFQTPLGTGYTNNSQALATPNPISSAAVVTGTSSTSRQIQFGLKIMF